jgi:hypothetical protein
MKVNARSFKGIEFIQISDLPPAQQEKILETIDHEFLIKILIDKKVLSNCIQYKDYEQWFEKYYVHEINEEKEPSLLPSSVEAIA